MINAEKYNRKQCINLYAFLCHTWCLVRTSIFLFCASSVLMKAISLTLKKKNKYLENKEVIITTCAGVLTLLWMGIGGGGGSIQDTNPTMSLMDSNVVSEILTN